MQLPNITGLAYEGLAWPGRTPESSHLPEQPSENMKRSQNVNEQPSPPRSALHKQEPAVAAAINRAAERGIKRRWKKVDVKRR